MVEIKNIHGAVIARLDDYDPDTMYFAFFNELDLSYVDFKDVDLSDASFHFCNLTGADFRGADMHSAEINCCELAGADFRGTNLRSARLGMTDDIECDAIIDEETTLPSHHHHLHCC